MRQLSKVLIVCSMFLLTMLLLNWPTSIHAQSSDTTNKLFGACDQAPSSPVCANTVKNNNKNQVVTVINEASAIIATLTGIGAVIVIIIGGFSFVTAGGNTEQATAARRRILSAVIGLVIVLF